MSILRRVAASPPPQCAVRLQRRLVGEQTGLSALAARQDRRTRYRPEAGYGHDPLTGGGPVEETQVDSYSASGFVVNGVALRGPVLLLPEGTFLFSVPRLAALSTESLEVFDMLSEPIELLVFGCGRSIEQLPAGVHAWLRERSIAPELFSTRQACANFNFMIQERRAAGAVLFPLRDDVSPLWPEAEAKLLQGH